MADLNLKSFDQLYPIMIRKYQTLVTDPNASVIDKINTIMTGLNATGKLTNDVVKNWNTVMEWVMNDGLTTDVSNKLDAMVANGTFTSLINTQITPMIGDITTLTTTDKTNLVHAVNELQGKQVVDEANIATNIASLAESMPLTGVNTHSLQTTYDTNGNLTQSKEFDVNSMLILQTDITYNSDGSIHTVTETFNGKQHVTTLNYVNGSLDPVNPMTRSVI